MKSIPNKISQPEFKKVLAGKRSYVPKKVTDTLKKVGLNKLKYQKEVSKEQMLKALKVLQAQGAISDFQRPDQLYRQAGLRQQQINEAKRAEVLHRRARLDIQMDLEKEADKLKADEDEILGFKRRPDNPSGQNVHKQLKDQQVEHDPQVQQEIKELYQNNSQSDHKSSLPNTKDVVDLDIG